MPNERTHTVQDLADLADVSPRTIRYYVAQGLLPPPGQVGPGAHYGEGHLARLRLIRRLQREHLPLAEIRSRLAALDDASVVELIEADAAPAPEGSALDYVRSILGDPGRVPPVDQRSLGAPASRAVFALSASPRLRPMGVAESQPAPYGPPPSPPHVPAQPSTENAGARSQWDRVTLAPDIELHIRRPLSRLQNKRVDRLIAIARELLEEDPS